MRIGLHDSDKIKFPNLALMKISAVYKHGGNSVEFFNPENRYDHVFSSKVFTFTNDDLKMLSVDKITFGGTGSCGGALPDHIEHCKPDYSLYNSKFSQGFLTRGCPNKCSWCIVPDKEGDIMPHADIEEFLNHREVILMDNNVLAHDHGIDQIAKMAKLNLKVDFNQGLDARRIDDGVAKRLAALKWLHPLRLACDKPSQMDSVQKAVRRLRYHNCTPTRFFVYVLVKNIDDALERVKFLKGLGIDPFAQPYRDFKKNTEPTKEQKRFARWVNHKAIFKTTTWEEYGTIHTT